MTDSRSIARIVLRTVVAITLWTGIQGCTRPDPTLVQGYVEGEFVYVASPYAGALESLAVQRGQQVKEGDGLFRLNGEPEQAAREEAERRLSQAKATLEDAKKGKRPSEIDVIKAQLKQARIAVRLSEREFTRQEALSRVPGATSELELDRTRATRDQDRHRVSELQAELDTAQAGSRSDQIAAAEAEVRAREAALAKAAWELSQKQQQAPKAGLVFETLYREGEWVAAGRPVVVLLPPQNIKVRAFVSQEMVGTLQPGQSVRVSVDGVAEPFVGTVNYISPKAEFTPPVIYSRESRSKLVFMIEARFNPSVAAKLHPGQPVDVRIGGDR
ncbi:Multidrug resistance efflux pump [Nitrospira japonica]|uniref:Multidrug resistance efflux pump n=1 Tax=Nitrospira japonica TaxID=1325564 RepID=A0A1W1IAJ0_9BACT|nr:HlyD family efflux transporter periplasmic adaptor subunit [Nitrospira japonica]SLM49889.1 Multidrug resistance efflux pump [Nitrospira japonica]